MQMFYLVFMMCRWSVMAVMVVVKMVLLDIQACFAVSKKKKSFQKFKTSPRHHQMTNRIQFLAHFWWCMCKKAGSWKTLPYLLLSYHYAKA